MKILICLIKYLVIGILVVLGFLLLGYSVAGGLEKQERYECQKWQADAQKYTGFYLTLWQLEQCENYGIKVIK